MLICNFKFTILIVLSVKFYDISYSHIVVKPMLKCGIKVYNLAKLLKGDESKILKTESRELWKVFSEFHTFLVLCNLSVESWVHISFVLGCWGEKALSLL